MFEEFQLTNEETELLNKKLKTLDEFKNYFSKTCLSNLDSNFSLKEVLSNEYEKFFFMSGLDRRHYVASFSYTIEKNLLWDNKSNEINIKQWSGEKQLKFLSDIFKRFEEIDERNPERALSLINGVCTNVPIDKICNFMMESSYCKKLNLLNSSRGFTMLDSAISSKMEGVNILEFIKTLQKDCPEYHNYALAVLNPNIKTETREKILKTTFRKKDFPAFRKTFISKVTDAGALVVFTEVTIFKNNRVQNKRSAFISFLKEIFINPSAKIYYEKINNFKVFKDKYNEYFTDESFMLDLYRESVASLSTNQYYRHERYSEFVQNLFSDKNINELIELIGNNKALSCLRNKIEKEFSSIKKEIDLLKLNDNEKKVVKPYILFFVKQALDSSASTLIYQDRNENMFSIQYTIMPEMHDCIKVLSNFIDEPLIQKYFSSIYTKDVPRRLSKRISYEEMNREILSNPETLKYTIFFDMNAPLYSFSNLALRTDSSACGTIKYDIETTITVLNNILDYIKTNNDFNTFKVLREKILVPFESLETCEKISEGAFSLYANEKTRFLRRYSWETDKTVSVVDGLNEIFKLLKEIGKFIYLSIGMEKNLLELNHNLDASTESLNLLAGLSA